MILQTLTGHVGPAPESFVLHDDLESRATPLRQVQFVRDCAAFGCESAEALQQLSPDVASLNRRYRLAVESRDLRRLPEISAWRGRTARVFLRHDAVFVFAIACGTEFGMTNSVELRDVRFEVDLVGRAQTLEHRGPLAGQTAVHACLSGILADMSDEWERDGQSELPHPVNSDGTVEWRPVLYRPTEHQTFVDALDQEPVVCASCVLMIPGPVKVWRLAGIETASRQGRPKFCGGGA